MIKEITRRSLLLGTIVAAGTYSIPRIRNTPREAPKNEIDLLAKMIFGEARSCTAEEQIAVAHTALNRLNHPRRNYGNTLSKIILAPNQYHSFRPDNPNYPKVQNPQQYELKAFKQNLDVARGVLSNRYRDPTNGATHFSLTRVEKWDAHPDMTLIGRIPTSQGPSKHVFYQEQ